MLCDVVVVMLYVGKKNGCGWDGYLDYVLRVLCGWLGVVEDVGEFV